MDNARNFDWFGRGRNQQQPQQQQPQQQQQQQRSPLNPGVTRPALPPVSAVSASATTPLLGFGGAGTSFQYTGNTTSTPPQPRSILSRQTTTTSQQPAGMSGFSFQGQGPSFGGLFRGDGARQQPVPATTAGNDDLTSLLSLSQGPSGSGQRPEFNREFSLSDIDTDDLFSSLGTTPTPATLPPTTQALMPATTMSLAPFSGNRGAGPSGMGFGGGGSFSGSSSVTSSWSNPMDMRQMVPAGSNVQFVERTMSISQPQAVQPANEDVFRLRMIAQYAEGQTKLYRDQLQRVQAQLTQSQIRCRTLAQYQTQFQEASKNATAEKIRIELQLTECQSELKILKSSYDTAVAEATNLRENINTNSVAYTREKERLEQTISELNEKLTQKNKQYEAARKELLSAKQELKTLQRELEEKDQAQKLLNIKVAGFESQIQTLNSQIEAIRSDLDSERARIKTLQEDSRKCSGLESQLDNIHRELSEKQRGLVAEQARLNELKEQHLSENRESKREIESLNQSIENKSEVINQLDGVIQTIKNENTALESRVKDLDEELRKVKELQSSSETELADKVRDSERRAEELQVQVGNLKEALLNKTRELDEKAEAESALKTKVDEMSLSIEEANTWNASYQKEINELNVKLAEKNHELTELNRLHEVALQQQQTTYEQQISELTGNISSLEEQLNNARSEIDEKTSTILDQQKEGARQLEASLEQKKTEYEEQLEELQGKLKNVTSELEASKAEAGEQSKATEKHEETVRQLQASLAEKQAEYESQLKDQKKESEQLVADTIRQCQREVALKERDVQRLTRELEHAKAKSLKAPKRKHEEVKQKPAPKKIRLVDPHEQPSASTVVKKAKAASNKSGSGSKSSAAKGKEAASSSRPKQFVTIPRDLKQVFENAEALGIPQHFVSLGYPVVKVKGKDIKITCKEHLRSADSFSEEKIKKVVAEIKFQYFTRHGERQTPLQKEGVGRVWNQAVFFEAFMELDVVKAWLHLPHDQFLKKLSLLEEITDDECTSHKDFSQSEIEAIKQWRGAQDLEEEEKGFTSDFWPLDWLEKLAKESRNNSEDKLTQLAGCWADLSMQHVIAYLDPSVIRQYKKNKDPFNWRKLGETAYASEPTAGPSSQKDLSSNSEDESVISATKRQSMPSSSGESSKKRKL